MLRRFPVYDIPLHKIVTIAKESDSPLLRPLLMEVRSGWFRLSAGTVVTADRGYDSLSNNEFVHSNGGVPVIYKCRTQGGKLHDGIYKTDDIPTCLGRVAMGYVYTEPSTGRHLYCCSATECRRKERGRGYAVCGDESWEDPESDIRLFGGRIRRNSPKWQAKYGKRWGVERVFGGWKQQGRLEQRRCFGLRRVRAHVKLQILMILADALVRAKAGGYDNKIRAYRRDELVTE